MKRLFALVLSLALLLSLAPVQAEKPYAGTELRVLLANHMWSNALEPHLKEFEELTGIKLNVEMYAEDQLSQKLAIELAGQSKDLARVPVWTGGQLLWVEGKVFSDGIDNADGKTFSRFELAKGLRQQIEALGGVRVSERSYDRDFYTANEKALDDFRQEFDDLQDAYWYDKDVDTYAIRRADGVVWVVLQTRNDDAAVLVAEGPAPALD